MSRDYPYRKTVVESCARLSVFDLRRNGVLGDKGGNAVVFSPNRRIFINVTVYMDSDPYVRIESQESTTHEVSLTLTRCNLGGVRWWFFCPLCSERVAVLYLRPRFGRFRCRHCNDLSYSSRNEPRSGGWLGLMNEWRRLLDQKDKVEPRVKRKFYRGRPTRKFRRLQTLTLRLIDISEAARRCRPFR